MKPGLLFACLDEDDTCNLPTKSASVDSSTNYSCGDSNKNSMSLSNFTLLKVLGKGSFGKVSFDEDVLSIV
jgi:hypothetical protein